MDPALCSNFLYIDIESKEKMLKNLLGHFVVSTTTFFTLLVFCFFVSSSISSGIWFLIGGLAVLSLFILGCFFQIRKNFRPTRLLLFNSICLLKSSIDLFALTYCMCLTTFFGKMYTIFSILCMLGIVIFLFYRKGVYEKGLFRKKKESNPQKIVVRSGILASVLFFSYKLLASFFEKITNQHAPSFTLFFLLLSFSFLGLAVMYAHNYFVGKKENIDLPS